MQRGVREIEEPLLEPPARRWGSRGGCLLARSLGPRFTWLGAQSLTPPPPSPSRADHGITGPILIHLDHEALRDVGIHSVGQRLAILRAVYALKVQQNIPVEVGQWVPPCEFLFCFRACLDLS